MAIDVARTNVRCGAESIAMYCLEDEGHMPASQEEVSEAKEEGIDLNCGWGPKEILSENGRVTGVVFKKCVSVFDEEGKFNPVYDENNTITVPCENVFVSIGQSIEWGNLLEGSKVKLGPGNRAIADSLTYQSGQGDIFVGETCTPGLNLPLTPLRQEKRGPFPFTVSYSPTLP